MGNGSFGKVYKVKCLRSSKINNQDNSKRISLIENTDGNIIDKINRENSFNRNLQKGGLSMDNVLFEKRKQK